MAVLMIVEVPGGTIDMYDQLNQEMGVGADNLPEGCLSHTAAFSDEGVIVADVWESAEAFQRFAEQQLGPAAQKTGLPPIEPRVHPVHNRLDGKGTSADTLVVIEVPGMTTADYDTMAAAMPSHQNNDHAAVSHTVARTDDGIIVVDIWG